MAGLLSTEARAALAFLRPAGGMALLKMLLAMKVKAAGIGIHHGGTTIPGWCRA